MSASITRRTAIFTALAAGSAIASWPRRAHAAADAAALVAEIEARNGGRLGVAAVDTGSGKSIGHRADERFPMCSTFKLLAVALVLTRVDRGEEQLDRQIAFSERDLVDNSPVTKAHVGAGSMSVAEICEATLTRSDNAGANLLLASFGGPPAVTAYARSLGDTITRLDRNETEVNEAQTGDPRDTTTPAAMIADIRRIVLGDALSGASRDQLTAWLEANKTGRTRLRAGLPPSWRVGDKTGTGANGATADIGVIWPDQRPPIVAAVYFTEAAPSETARNAIIADVGRIIAETL